MLAAFLIVVILACIAFAVDVGSICLVRAQAQNAADAAALAAAQELFSEERLRGEYATAHAQACEMADEYAARHRIGPHNARLVTAEDVAIGRLELPSVQEPVLNQGDPSAYNALTVVVRATRERGQSARLFFAPIWGRGESDVEATATAAFVDRIVGFKPPPGEAAPLLPFTLQIDFWKASLLLGVDEWRYDSSGETVTAGSDQIPEIHLYPLATGSGNFGTLNYDPAASNGSNIQKRQIREGVTADDLQAYGGELVLDAQTQSVNVQGSPGLDASLGEELQKIIGQPRTIPLYSVTNDGHGGNLSYKIVGFAGVRVVYANLTGGNKKVTVQPAYVVHKSAQGADWAPVNEYIRQPVRLVW